MVFACFVRVEIIVYNVSWFYANIHFDFMNKHIDAGQEIEFQMNNLQIGFWSTLSSVIASFTSSVAQAAERQE